MTIKPVINQKSNEKNKDHGSAHNQVDQQVQSVGNNHRNVINNNNVEGYPQGTQRRSDVFDDLSRHRRSPHKSGNNRLKRSTDHHHTVAKRGNNDRDSREKLTPSATASHQYLNHQVLSGHTHGGGKSPHAHSSVISVAATAGVACSSTKSPKHHSSTSNTNIHAIVNQSGSSSPKCQGSPRGVTNTLSGIGNVNSTENIFQQIEETLTGYNSGDEWIVPKEGTLTIAEWTKRDEQFINSMEKRGLMIKDVAEDGACLFRAISLQIYGDQEMHDLIRQQTMDYIYQNSEYFAHFVTEDINNYVKRKRNINSHGNHIEIQAMSELYNRPVELYCYQTTPINIFNSEQINKGHYPLRLSYMRGSHYNAILDPYNASVGVGLGLAGYKPPESQTGEAIKLSEQLEIEQTMFEDKLKTTDWEATNEALQEQVARESYLQWCRENMMKNRNNNNNIENSTNMRENSMSSRTEENSNRTTTTSGSATSSSSNSTITSAEAFKNSYVKQLKQQPTAITFTESRFITSVKTTTASGFGNKSNNNNNIFGSSASASDTSKITTTTSHFHVGTMLKKNLSTSSGVVGGCSSIVSGITSSVNSSCSTFSDGTVGNNNSGGIGDSPEYCCDSDDTDMSSTSSIDPNLEMLRMNNNNTSNNTTVSSKSSDRKKSKRLKRKYKWDGENLWSNQYNKGNVFHVKKMRNDVKHQQHNTENAVDSIRLDENLNSCISNTTPDPQSTEKKLIIDKLPSTSKQYTEEKPVSTFYHSLLESSYTFDGISQLTENEMIKKAIQMSRIDYIEDQKLKYGYFQVQHQDNDDDST